jgi:hypothetical protein
MGNLLLELGLMWVNIRTGQESVTQKRSSNVNGLATDVQFAITGRGILKVGGCCSELRMYSRVTQMERFGYA